MPALTLRPAPLPWVVALRALPAVVVAVAGGAWLALAVGVACGVDLGGGAAVWIGVAGACACVSGVMIGAGGSAPAAAVLAVAAIGAVVLAAGTDADSNPARSAFAPRADLAPPARGETRAERPSRPISASTRAGRFVRSYYAAIDAGAFATAWAQLSPAVRAQFGGFAFWRAGYGTTLDQRVEAVEVDGAQIRHILVARDRTPCGGTVEQRFAVVWTMADGRAASLQAVRLAGQDPAAAC